MNKIIFILCLSVIGILSMGHIESPAYASSGVFVKADFGPSSIGLDDGDINTNSSEGAALSVSAGAKFNDVVSVYLDWKGASVSNFDGCASCELGMGSRGFPGLGVGLYSKSNFNTHLVINTVTINTDGGESSRFPMVYWSVGKDWTIIDLDNFLGVSGILGRGTVDGIVVSSATLALTYTYR